MKTRRPVRFIVYDDLSSKKRENDTEKCPPNKKMKTSSNDTTRIKLPNMSRKELLYRNLERFYHTGRYIPMRALVASMDRYASLLSQATKSLQSIENDFPTMQEEWYLDYALCQLAGYVLDTERYVTKIEGFSERNTSNNFHQKNKNGKFNRTTRQDSLANPRTQGINY